MIFRTLKPNEVLRLGDAFEARIYFAPSMFGTHQEDRKKIVEQYLKDRENPDHIFSKTTLTGSTVVTSPAPGDENQDPYVCLKLKVIKNPPPLLAAALIAAISYTLITGGVIFAAVTAITLGVWIADAAGLTPTLWVWGALAIVGIYFWKGNKLPKWAGG